MSGPPQKQQRVEVSSRRMDDDNDRLSSLLVPILERMQEEGSLLTCLLSAFEDDRDLLSSRLQHKLPNRWIKAPDQRKILEHNWVIDGYAAYGRENSDQDGDLEPAPFLIDFRDNKIELGYYAGIKKIQRKDLSVSKNSVFCNIRRGGCGECYNDECYDFELQQNPHLNQYRLKIEQYVLCRCGGDGDEPCEESSYAATIKQGRDAGGQAPKLQAPATGDQFAEI